MVSLEPFEIEVIARLTTGVFSRELLRRVIRDGDVVSIEHTGVGYFYTFRHPSLPTERRVCNAPVISGKCNGIETGFIVFIERNELTLECYSFGNQPVPEDYRRSTVSLHLE
jgi:hypothetical protein